MREFLGAVGIDLKNDYKLIFKLFFQTFFDFHWLIFMGNFSFFLRNWVGFSDHFLKILLKKEKLQMLVRNALFRGFFYREDFFFDF